MPVSEAERRRQRAFAPTQIDPRTEAGAQARGGRARPSAAAEPVARRPQPHPFAEPAEPAEPGQRQRQRARQEAPRDDDDADADDGEGRVRFREQALQALAPRAHGDILLSPGRASGWTAAVAALLLAALAGLLVLGSYTRRSTVVGRLVPDQGLLRITTPQGGLLLERHASEQQVVRRGQLLFVLSGERLGPGLQEVQRDIAQQIALRRTSLEDELRRLDDGQSREAERQRQRESVLEAEQARLERQLQLQASRVEAAQDAVTRYRSLAAQGYVSRDELQLREVDLTEQRARGEALQRERLALRRDAESGRRELDAQRLRQGSQRAETERALALLQQELTETEARRRIVVTAPADGVLSLVRGEPGQSVEPQAVLAQLLPQGADLQARLYAPSRAAGFTQAGTAVQLRYDAYPWQKFGQATGQVLTVGRTPAPADEVPPATDPQAAAEAMFPITVRLPAQSVAGTSGPLPLSPGMRVEAVLMHESRPLYEWVLEPVFALRSRLAPPGVTLPPVPPTPPAAAAAGGRP